MKSFYILTVLGLGIVIRYSGGFAAAQVNFPGRSTSSTQQESRNRPPSITSRDNFQSNSGSSGRRFNNNGGSGSNNFGSGSSSNSGGSGCCQPAAQCAALLNTRQKQSRQVCSLPGGSSGLCCSSQAPSSSARSPFRSADDSNFSVRRTGGSGISDSDFRFALRQGQAQVSNVTRFASRFASPARGTGAFYHARFQRQARRATRQQGQGGLLIEEIAKGLLSSGSITTRQGGGNRFGGSGGDAVNFGPNVEARQSLGSEVCPGRRFCSSSQYRSIDGSCNNLQEGNWGRGDTVFNRILLPDYADGLEAPRRSKSGSQLPSPRFISTRLAKDFNQKDPTHSAILMSFGQFIDHDLTHSPILSGNQGQDLDCCSSSGVSSDDQFCLPINIPFSDTFFRGRKTCMNFVRSTPGPSPDCSIRYREQINQLTHWLDLSQVYGSTQEELNAVRSFRGGQLRTSSSSDGPLLPTDNADTSCKAGACMKAGDGRVNEQPSLSLLHTIFMREHNRIAQELSASNSRLSDETIFQEARAIMIGEWQHIIYNEWLPIVLGEQFMRMFGLFPKKQGFSNDYDSSIDPRITNEFAAAGFRFGHSLISGLIKIYGRVGRETDPSISLREAFFKPELLRLPGFIDGLVKGLTQENVERFDSSFSEDITNHLFDGDINGMDLVALNIQRGRDHGLPGYTKYRQLCGVGATNSFSDLSRSMPVRRTEELQNVYANPEDIDLFVGMFSERPQSDSLVGPTTLCILGDQFARLKKGDRFFYDLPQSGNNLQRLEQIRRTSLSRLLCDNSGIREIQPLAFLTPSSSNPVISCTDFGAIPRPIYRN